MIFLWSSRGTPRPCFTSNDWGVETIWISGQAAWSPQINYIKARETRPSFSWSFEACPALVVNSSLSKACLWSWRSPETCWDGISRWAIPVPHHSALIPCTGNTQLKQTVGRKNVNWLAGGCWSRRRILAQLQEVTRCQCPPALQCTLRPAGEEKPERVNPSKALSHSSWGHCPKDPRMQDPQMFKGPCLPQTAWLGRGTFPQE